MVESISPTFSGHTLPRLAGRDREQAVLRDRLAAARAGHGDLVLIGGEAGIGKTALAEALLAEANGQAALVLAGHCYDLSETPSYGPWREVFARAPRDAALPALPTAVLPLERDGAVLASQGAILARVHAFLAALAARQPLVLLLEDVHWADPASLDLLRVVARDLADTSLLLLATYRADEIDRRHPLYALLPALVREARATRLDLRALDEAALRILVRDWRALADADTGRLVAYLLERADGNPFFALELLRALVEEGRLRRDGGGWRLGNLDKQGVPPLLRQVIDGRVDRLGAATQRLLAVAAVLGQEVSLDLWATVSGEPVAFLLDVLERAIDAHVLVATPERTRFAHALVRAALYEGTLPARRRDWHRRAGEALAALPYPDPDAVAYHFQQARDAQAPEWLLRAGERAQHAYAWLTAADRYEAALPLLAAGGATADERGWQLVRIARLRRYADPRGCLVVLDEAARLAATAGDRALAACIRCHQGVHRCHIGNYPAGIADMAAGADALDALPAADRARLQERQRQLGVAVDEYLRGALVLALAEAGRYAEAGAMGARLVTALPAPPVPDWLDDAPYADAWAGLGRVHAALGRPAEARRAYARAADLYHAVGHHHMGFGTALAQLAWVELPYATTDLAARRDLLTQVAALAGRTASAGVKHPLVEPVRLLYLEGRWAEARQEAEAVLGLDLETHIHTCFALTGIAELAGAQGDPALGWATVHALVAAPDVAPGNVSFPDGLAAQRGAAGLALDAGDLPTARAWLAAHDRWLAWSGNVLGQAEGHLAWAEYHRAAGDAALATEQAERARILATAPRQPLALLAAHRLLGELATEGGSHAEAQGHLDAALALADACAAPYERALTLLALAELRLAEGQPRAAEQPLAEARAICTGLQARPALARCDAIAMRLTRTVPTPAASLPVALSAREIEVLRLLAAGLDTPAIAASLTRSPHTVRRHIEHLYRKIDAHNKADAIAYAFRHHLV
ncbi:MAG: helix-turn-helix transcriptional regulator [Thermomicrobiales bacterium]